MYKVITDFADLQDGGHVYRAGDSYPRSGSADSSRVKELSGTGNKLGVPLIVEEKVSKSRKKPKEG